LRFERALPYFLVTPTLFLVLLFIVYPFISGIWTSLHKSTFGIELGPFVGFDNYIKIFTRDDVFWQDFTNTIVWTVGNLGLQTVLGLGGALLLNRSFKGQGLARSIIIIPWVIPTVVTALMWRWILEPDLGILNNILFALRLITQPVVYLGSPSYAMLTAIVINTWRFSPFAVILILAALQTIPNELYESAEIDGATPLRSFIHITMPLLTPMLSFVGFIAFVWTFNMFDIIWLTTEGGPANATETLPVLVFRRAFLEYRMGEAAAVTVFMFLFLLAFSLIFLRRR
jgi:multiple sugar transport system permease protein